MKVKLKLAEMIPVHAVVVKSIKSVVANKNNYTNKNEMPEDKKSDEI